MKKQLVAIHRKSPGTPLRRIQSMEHQSSSRITLSTDTTSTCSIDLFDDDVMKIIDNSDSGSSSSIDSSPVFPRRLHAGSSQSLPRSYSPRLDKKEESTDASLPKVLVAPRRSYSVGRRGSGSSSTFQRTPSPFSQLEEIKEGESPNMLPLQHLDRMTTARDSISGSLLSLPQCILSPEFKTCIDISGAWDTHSVIMRVSSATGQLEEVPSHTQTLPKSLPKLFTTKIMKLSEEPQAVIGRRRGSSTSLVSNGTIKRRSIVLDSIVTDV